MTGRGRSHITLRIFTTEIYFLDFVLAILLFIIKNLTFQSVDFLERYKLYRRNCSPENGDFEKFVITELNFS